MTDAPHLSRAAISQLEDALARVRPGSRSGDFRRLLTAWAELADEVAGEYPLTAYDYTNDLTARTMLQMAIDNAPVSARTEAQRVIDEIDARFRDGTRQVDAALIHGGPAAWWVRRVPLRLSPDARDTFDER